MTYRMPQQSARRQSRALASGSGNLAAEASLTRRRFLKRSSLLALSAAVGAHIPFGRFFPEGLIPVALAQAPDLKLYGKNAALIVLGDKPFVAETPAHLLDDDVTPAEYLFIRNNGLPPTQDKIDPAQWTLTVDGESAKTATKFTLGQLKKQFKAETYHLAIECGGNGRSEFFPPAKGNQWTTGGVGFPEWTGVRLKDVLQQVGVKDDAVYIGYYGADLHVSGDASKEVISRGVPIAKALEQESLIAWAMNGKDLPWVHGYPLRLVLSGYPGSVSGKWLTRITIRNKVHDGAKMGGHDYRLPCDPIAPGEASDNYCIMEGMPIKSLVTFPKSGFTHDFGKPLSVRGQAWTNTESVAAVDVSIDFGQSWTTTQLRPAKNRYGPQRWVTEIQFPKKGYYEIWARASDDKGRAQPMVVAGWNTGGYGNNACHRIAVRVA
jgi:sulfite oxidase